jgi:retron-type reverse transcriptase
MVMSGSVRIKVNNEVGHYFKTKRGLCQGDPMSPILFNIVVDMLAIWIKRAKQDGQINEIILAILIYHAGQMRDYQYYSMQMIPSSSWTMTLNKPNT